MGLFFNYDKPGPGVDKNAPKKKGVALFFELLGRNLRKLLLANIIYFAVSLPISLLYYVIISMFLANVIPEAVGTAVFIQFSILLTLLVVIFWGTGPVSCGYTYILRNTAREEHTFLASDFFEKSKEGLFHGLVFLIVDTVMLFTFATSVLTYWNLSGVKGGIYTLLLALSIFMILMYTMMHFYLYEMEVTFTNKLIGMYKNSFLMAVATLPMCLLVTAIICVISFTLLSYFTPIAIIIVAFLCWISLMRFIIDFYAARAIKRNLLSKYEETDGEESN